MRASDMRGAAVVFGANPEARLALIRALWPQLVGEQVARQTEVASITGNFLRLRVADPRWRKVLPRLRRDILNRLQQALGALAPRQIGLLEARTGVTARLAEVADDEPRRGTRAPRPAPATPPPALLEAACVIRDEELRGRFLATASRYLTTTRTQSSREPDV